VVHRRTNRQESDSAYDIVRDTWLRRKWVAIGVFTTGVVAAAAMAVSLPTLYRSAATVLVERQQVSEAFVRPSVTAELETRIQTIHQQVMSRARLTQLITDLKLYPERVGKVPMHALVEQMRRDVRLDLKGVDQRMTGRPSTIAFSLSYTGRDPDTVARVANTLVAFYIDENTKSRERQADRTAEFLRDQLGEIRRELQAQEARASDFRLRHTTELPQQLEANLAALERLNTQLRLNGEYQIRAMERRERLEELASAKAMPATAPGAGPAGQLRELQRRLAELRSQFSEQYPDVIKVQSEIAALQRQTPGLGTNGDGDGDHSPGRVQQGLASVNKELQSLKQEEAFLRKAIGGYEGRVESAPRRQQELQQLTRDYELTKERHDALLKRYEEAQLAANLEQGQNVEQFQILDPALPPTQPAAPNRLWLLLMGCAASLGLAFAAVLVLERLDTTFHTVDDLRAFVGVPTLATIQRMVTEGDIRRARRRFVLIGACALVVLAAIAAGVVYVADGNEFLVRLTARG
jgi:polysaccharide chain length determinant protein (PEP-CTERM system associated)